MCLSAIKSDSYIYQLSSSFVRRAKLAHTVLNVVAHMFSSTGTVLLHKVSRVGKLLLLVMLFSITLL